MGYVELYAKAFGPDDRFMVMGEQLARVFGELGEVLPSCQWVCDSLDLSLGVLPAALRPGRDGRAIVASTGELALLVNRHIQFTWGVFAAFGAVGRIPSDYRMPAEDGYPPASIAPALALVRAFDNSFIDVSIDDEAVLGEFGRKFAMGVLKRTNSL